MLADEVMAGTTGTQLTALALHEIRPDLPVLLVTGYSGPVRSDQLHAAGLHEGLNLQELAVSLIRHLHSGLSCESVVRGGSAMRTVPDAFIASP